MLLIQSLLGSVCRTRSLTLLYAQLLFELSKQVDTAPEEFLNSLIVKVSKDLAVSGVKN
jgi:hypothetical protein